MAGAYSLNKLDEFETWSKQKASEEMAKKLERNKAREHTEPLPPPSPSPRGAALPLPERSHRATSPTATAPNATRPASPRGAQEAFDEQYKGILGENYQKWFGTK